MLLVVIVGTFVTLISFCLVRLAWRVTSGRPLWRAFAVPVALGLSLLFFGIMSQLAREVTVKLILSNIVGYGPGEQKQVVTGIVTLVLSLMSAALLVLLGPIIVRTSQLRFRRFAPQPAEKTCPRCAETVKAAAQVCRYCWHDFAPPPLVLVPVVPENVAPCPPTRDTAPSLDGGLASTTVRSGGRKNLREAPPHPLVGWAFLIVVLAVSLGIGKFAAGTAWHMCSSSAPDGGIEGCTLLLSQSIPEKSRAVAYIVRGEAYRRIGEYEEAIADATEAIRINSDNAVAYTTRGAAFAIKGAVVFALADLNEAIRLDPKHGLAYYYRGSSYEKMGEKDQAVASFSEAIRLDPKDARALPGSPARGTSCATTSRPKQSSQSLAVFGCSVII